jgi:hypothetical protein
MPSVVNRVQPRRTPDFKDLDMPCGVLREGAMRGALLSSDNGFGSSSGRRARSRGHWCGRSIHRSGERVVRFHGTWRFRGAVNLLSRNSTSNQRLRPKTVFHFSSTTTPATAERDPT